MLNKLIKIIIAASILIFVSSMFYYFVIFLPSKERSRLELEKKGQTQQSLAEFNRQKEIYREECQKVKDENMRSFQSIVESCGGTESCIKQVNNSFTEYGLLDQDFVSNCIKSKQETGW